MILKDPQLSFSLNKMMNLRHLKVNLIKSRLKISQCLILIFCVKRVMGTDSMNSVFAVIFKFLSQIRITNSSYHNAMHFLIHQTIHYSQSKKEVNLKSQPYINLTARIASFYKNHSALTNCILPLFPTKPSLTTRVSSISWEAQTANRTKS